MRAKSILLITKVRIDMNNQEKQATVPTKYTISTLEASQWSGIGINRLRDIMNDKYCPFVLMVGERKRVKTEAFKQWLDDQYSV